jgi:hypothetical protein
VQQTIGHVQGPHFLQLVGLHEPPHAGPFMGQHMNMPVGGIGPPLQ